MPNDYLFGMPEIVVRFLNYQSTIKNKSQLTIDEYCLDLRLFIRFTYCSKNNLDINDMDKLDISGIKEDFFAGISLNDAYQFLSYCRNERNNHEKARARKVSSIRTFFK